ncbi:MAG: tetratricopeptide repeat protein [Planctomycetes bacterium]|nr:tetratricopeptide repeat protein [Planctomycetota bacterium]
MPTINKRLLLKLCIAMVIFGVGLFIIHHVQADRAIDALRWQAERSAETGRLDKAIIYMRQYLELRPSDHEAAVKLGDLILSKGNNRKDLSNVLFLYERVLRESPGREDLRRKLVDICLKLNRHGDATIHARALLNESSRDGELWEKLAIAQSSQNKHDEARVSLEKAVEYDPTRIRSYEFLAELLIRQLNLPEDGKKWIEKMVRANPLSGDAYLTRARYLRSQNRVDDCFQDLERLLELDPENVDGLLILADLLQAKGEIAKARTVLADGISLHHKDVRYYRSLSWLELSSGNSPAAIACLEQGLKLLPNTTELLAPLGDMLIQQSEFERVGEIIRKLEKARNTENQILYLRARVLMQREKWAEAAPLLDSLRTDAVAVPGRNAQVNMLIAACQERLGNREAQVEALNRVVTIDPGHLNARLIFGSLKLAAGELDEAVKEYIIAARSPFAPLGARMTLGRLLIARAKTKTGAGEWNIVADYVKAMREKYKNSVDPLLLAAEMHMARQQYDAARKLLRAEAGNKVNDSRIWSVLAAIALETDGLHAALDVLDEARLLVGDQAELRLARARIWAVDWQPGQFERVRALGREIDGLADVEQIRLLAGLAEICAAGGDTTGQKQLLQEMANRSPRDRGTRRALFQVALRTGDAVLRSRMKKELIALEDSSHIEVAEALPWNSIEAISSRWKSKSRS